MINPKKQKMWVGSQGATLHNTVGVKSLCLILSQSLAIPFCSSFQSVNAVSQLCPTILFLNFVPQFQNFRTELRDKIDGRNYGTMGQNNWWTVLKERIEGTLMDNRDEGQMLSNRVEGQNCGTELRDRIEGQYWGTVLKDRIEGQNN